MSEAQIAHLKKARETLREQRGTRKTDEPKPKKVKVVHDNDTAATFTLPVPTMSPSSSSSGPSTKTILIGTAVLATGAVLIGGGFFIKNKYGLNTKIEIPKDNAPNPSQTPKPQSHTWPN